MTLLIFKYNTVEINNINF